VLDYLDALTNSRSLEEVWRLHCATMKDYGFDRLFYGFTRFKTENSLGSMDDAILLSNHAPAYFRRFIDEELYLHAPMTRWATQNTGACSWSWMAQHESELTDKQRAVLAFNRQIGVLAGYSISFSVASSRARGIISLTARPGLSQTEVDQLWAEHGRTIEVLNNIAHLKIISLPQITERPRLSHRQREVLEWVGDGKTNQDIATILGVRPATVEKHLRLAREKLDVETTAQAVLKASFLNQMFVL